MRDINFQPDTEVLKVLKKESDEVISLLKLHIKKSRIKADTFIGGSFAKGTLVKKEEYDIDIFIRFHDNGEDLSNHLEIIIKSILKEKKLDYEKVHGSRDYFRLKKDNIVFELIPVLKIKRPKDAINVTDLSYFHVNYVKKNINKKIANEIAKMKSFCKNLGVYGAESYIRGFSGYAIECLMIYFSSFDKCLKMLTRSDKKIVIDPKKHYKNDDEVLLMMNESKLQSPIILVDPTWKERNVLAALSHESYSLFKKAAAEFIKKKDEKYFFVKQVNPIELKQLAKKKRLEFLTLKIYTNRQPGDIAGTKLKKFSIFIKKEISKFYEIKEDLFEYDQGIEGKLHLILKNRSSVIKIGPPSSMSDACIAFRKSNTNVYEKKGQLYSKIIISDTAKEFLIRLIDKYKKKIMEMDIIDIKTE